MKTTHWRKPVSEAMSELFPAARQLDDWQRDSDDAYCKRCGASIGPNLRELQRCPFCVKQRVPWARIVRLGTYHGPMEQWIRDMKFARGWTWAPWFGGQLAQVIGATRELKNLVVCAVPMHWSRRWRRGYDQADLMAQAVARQLELPMARLLTRTAATPPQTSVPHSKRRDNVKDSFGRRAIDATGWRVLLVDDVKTTGATLGACTAQLKAMGAAQVVAAVAAVADPADGDFTRV